LKVVAQMVTPGAGNVDDFVTVKLGNSDILNLALGKPRGSKIDKGIILAGVGDFEPHGTTNSPVERLIVFDPSQNGAAQVVATVAAATSITYQGGRASASKAEGGGFGTAMILDTVLGTPAENGFLSTPVNGGGQASGGHLGVDSHLNLVFPSISGIGTASGPLKFNFTDKDNNVVHFDGVILKAEGKVSGKPISAFTE